MIPTGQETDWILIVYGDQRILLLAGPIGVGKSSVVDVLRSTHDFRSIRSGAHLTKLLEQSGAQPTRAALVELGDQLDVDTDFEWVVRDVAQVILASDPGHSFWVFDSVRKRKQVEHFRRLAPQRTFLVYLSANEQTLRSRFDSRSRSSDELVSYDTAINTDNEREARSLEGLADTIQQTDDSTPEESASRIWEEFSEWSKSFS